MQQLLLISLHFENCENGVVSMNVSVLMETHGTTYLGHLPGVQWVCVSIKSFMFVPLAHANYMGFKVKGKWQTSVRAANSQQVEPGRVEIHVLALKWRYAVQSAHVVKWVTVKEKLFVYIIIVVPEVLHSTKHTTTRMQQWRQNKGRLHCVRDCEFNYTTTAGMVCRQLILVNMVNIKLVCASCPAPSSAL